MDLVLKRQQSRLHLPNYPNEVEILLENASPMYLHIGDKALKSLYNHFLHIGKGKIAVRNQYASTFVLQCMVRKDGNLIELEFVLNANKVLGFIHYGGEVFSTQSYRRVGLMLDDVYPFHLTFKDYEILRTSFIPKENKPPTAYPVWNAQRVVPHTKSGYPHKSKNQWGSSFAFEGIAHSSLKIEELRYANFITSKQNLVGYLNFDYKLD